MANFDYLYEKKEYSLFSGSCIAAERILATSLQLSVIGSYNALEFAVMWVYDIEKINTRKKYASLSEMIGDTWFRSLIQPDVYSKLAYIVKLRIMALQNPDSIELDDAILALNVLYEFVAYIDYVYGREYREHRFDVGAIPTVILNDVNIDNALITRTIYYREPSIIAQIESELLAVGKFFIEHKENNKKLRKFIPINYEDMKVRKNFVDIDLKCVGWNMDLDVKKNISHDFINDYYEKDEICMDYELLGSDGTPLAIIDGTYSLEDLENGRRKAIHVARMIAYATDREPAIFLLNGDNVYYMSNTSVMPRRVASIFAPADLERLRGLTKNLKNLAANYVNTTFATETYEYEAIDAILKNMSTGANVSIATLPAGLTKFGIIGGLIDKLVKSKFASNILFVTGRLSTVQYAKETLGKGLAYMSMGEYTSNVNTNGSLMLATTYAVAKSLGSIAGNGNRYFSPGEFDLVIIDDLYYSIISEYSDLLTYFECPIVALSSVTPEDIDQKFFDILKTKREDIVYSYHQEEALMRDRKVVPYREFCDRHVSHETPTYDKFNVDDKRRCEATYTDDVAKMLNWIPAPPINQVMMDSVNIDKMLQTIFIKGIKSGEDGELALTVIYAQNISQAELILQRFRLNYPEKPAEMIMIAMCTDDTVADRLMNIPRETRLVVDVGLCTLDMSLPRVANVAILKKVYSKFEFMQMIAVGNVPINDMELLYDGERRSLGKREYYIFDFVQNFFFFNERPIFTGVAENLNLGQQVFVAMVNILFELYEQHLSSADYKKYATDLIGHITEAIGTITTVDIVDNLKDINIGKYTKTITYEASISDNDKELLTSRLARYVNLDESRNILMFDNLMYRMIYGFLKTGEVAVRDKNNFNRILGMLMKKTDSEEIMRDMDYIQHYASHKFVEMYSPIELEFARQKVRPLIHLLYDEEIVDEANKNLQAQANIPAVHSKAVGSRQVKKIAPDEFSGLSERAAEYKRRVIKYIEENPDHVVVYKLQNNMNVSSLDMDNFRKILLKRLGTEADFEAAFGKSSICDVVRRYIVMTPKSLAAVFLPLKERYTLSNEQKIMLDKIKEYVAAHSYMTVDEFAANANNEFEGFYETFDSEQQQQIFAFIQSIRDKGR